MNMKFCYYSAVLMLAGIGFQSAIAGSLFYPKGRDSYKLCDDCFARVVLDTPFVFFCKAYNSLWANENGVLSFGRDFWSYFPENLPLAGDEGMIPMIAAFFADHHMPTSGKIFVNKVNGSKYLAADAAYVRYVYSNCHHDFKPTERVVITFENVAPICPGNVTLRNDYQIVLMTDGASSFVMLNFKRLEWFEACPGEPSVVGFQSGGNYTMELPYSADEINTLKLASKSNVGVAGRWFYRVSGSRSVTNKCEKDPCVRDRQYECACETVDPLTLKTYDGQTLKITRAQKTLLAQWGNNTTEHCKWSVVAKTSNVFNGVDVPLFVNWMALSFGPFPANLRLDKFRRSYKAMNGQVFVRGYDTKDQEQPVTLPYNWVSEDGMSDIVIHQNGETIEMRSNRCVYGLDLTQNNNVTTSYKIYTDHHDDMDGMCGDCDDLPNNDFKRCAGGGSTTNNDKITKSCEKGNNKLIG